MPRQGNRYQGAVCALVHELCFCRGFGIVANGNLRETRIAVHSVVTSELRVDGALEAH